jgi:hypothetical protein
MVNFSLILFAESEAVYTDGGILAEFSWLLVVLPFFAALLITFFGKYLPYERCRSSFIEQLGLIFIYSVLLMYLHITARYS